MTSSSRIAFPSFLLASLIAASALAFARGGADAAARAASSSTLRRDVSRYLRAHAGARYAVEEIDVIAPGYAQVEATIGWQLVLLQFYRHRERWALEALNCLSACGTRVPAA